MHYRKFAKNIRKKLVAIAGKKLTEKQMKAEFKKHICVYFYKHMDSAKKTRANKAKVSSGVTKLLKKTSVANTLAAVGAKKEAAGIAAAVKITKQTQVVRKSVTEEERKAALIINKLAKAVAGYRLEKKKNAAAAAKAKKVKFASSNKRKSPPSAVAAAVKKARVTRSSTAAAKRKLDTVQSQASRQSKRLKVAKKNLSSLGKKAKGRGIARRLDTTLHGGAVLGKRVRTKRVL